MKDYRKERFGQINNQDVWLYTLTTKQNVSVSVMTYGATLVRYCVSDSRGQFDNIVVSPNNFEEFIDNSAKWGATIGAVAGRIANGEFSLNGKQYQLEKNNNGNHLHGGSKGLDSRVFDVVDIQNDRITLRTHLADGVDGYPGNREFTVYFELSPTGELSITYQATSDKDTLINMTNHAYFNLSGDVLQPITNHYLKVTASAMTELNSNGIPTGRLISDSPIVTALQQGVYLDDVIHSKEPQITQFDGIDHGFYFENRNASCQLYDEQTKRILYATSTARSLVIYTANFVDDKATINGVPTIQHNGIALEMQQLPDAIHHEHFGSIVLKANDTYKTKTILYCTLANAKPF